MTEVQIAQLIQDIARNEGIEVEALVQGAAVDTLTVTLYSTGTTTLREEFTVPQPEHGEAREEFIGTVREHIRAIKGKLGQI